MGEPLIAEVRMFGGNFAPRSWALCDGQLLAISSNSALFSLLGTTYGGDGRTTFGLPDLRGRAAMHPGSGPGLTPRSLGEKGGQENVTLTVNQIPSHSHTVNCLNSPGDQTTPNGHFSAGSVLTGGRGSASVDMLYSTTANTIMATNALSNTGGSQQHTNIQPFVCVNYIIALYGVYPSRN